MNKIMVLIGTIFLIIAVIIQGMGITKEHESLRDGLNAFKDGNSDDLEDAMDEEIWAKTILNIALGVFMIGFIIIFIGFILPKMRVEREPEHYHEPPPQPTRKPAPPREFYD